MLEKVRLQKQDQLISLIYGIAAIETQILSHEEVLVKAKELKQIYAGGFRHQYSELFPAIKTISEGNTYDAEILLENLRLIREYVEQEYSATGQFNALYLPLLKLMDHINLELARLTVFNIDERRLTAIDRDFTENKEQLKHSQEQISRAQEQLENVIRVMGEERTSQESVRIELDKSAKLLEEANKQAENLQTQLVSVLSIFAAIVIAFSGGMSFLGNAISSIQNVIIYRSVLICLLCGLVLFNLVFLLLYIVGKIINRSIFAHCSSECSCSQKCERFVGQNASGCTPSCSGFKRVRKRLPYVFWVNFTGLLLCLLDVIAWYLRIRSIFPFNF